MKRFIFGAIGVMAILEIRYPGGDEREGVLGLTTIGLTFDLYRS